MFNENNYINIGLSDDELYGSELTKIYRPLPNEDIIFKEYYNRDTYTVIIGNILFSNKYDYSYVYSFLLGISESFAERFRMKYM